MSLNIWSDGMGSWSYGFLKPLLARTFPGTTITYDERKERKPDLVVRSHFQGHERAPPYSCPYIIWSGEAYPVAIRAGEPAPLLELNTAHTDRANEIWFPHLVCEHARVARPDPVGWPKERCCAFAFGNRVPQREELFLRMRAQEPTCHAFGRSCFTPDNPFVLGRQDRSRNDEMFHQHGYGLVVAMENKIAPGYLTEKIGYGEPCLSIGVILRLYQTYSIPRRSSMCATLRHRPRRRTIRSRCGAIPTSYAAIWMRL